MSGSAPMEDLAGSSASQAAASLSVLPDQASPHGSEPGSPDLAETLAAPPASPPCPRTRLQGGIRKPKVYTDGHIRYANFTSSGEPQCVDEVLGTKHWKEAMDVEFDALMKNKTWHLVPPKNGTNIIDCKWVYKTKLKSDGSLGRYKARLVAKGFKKDMT